MKVEVRKTEQGFRLVRNGEDYYVKGAGVRWAEGLKDAGANSIRIWKMEQAEAMLPLAEKNGFSLLAGLWVEHERHGFDYNDRGAVREQLESFRAYVERYKDHPSILAWALGNEMHLKYTNRKVWDAIEEAAQMVKSIDPNHPVMSVLAGPDHEAIEQISKRVPSLDILGINMYGEIEKLSFYMQSSAWKGPYLVTEWGPVGHWQCDRTFWGAPIEQSSAEKSEAYFRAYRSIENDPNCLGSYYFLWGQKQERTPTWYGLFLEERPELGLKGEMQEMGGTLARCWGGKSPGIFPSVQGLTLEGKTAHDSPVLKCGQTYPAMVQGSFDLAQTRLVWEVLEESTSQAAGGDPEERPASHPECLLGAEGSSLRLKAPMVPGNYRLFAYVLNDRGLSGSANLPFRCE